jgi:hypothetical protein
LFLAIFVFGFWVSRSGKPYSVLLLTVHKLIGVATGVYLVVVVSQIHKVNPLDWGEIAALGVSISLFLVLIATGGLLSTEKQMPVAVHFLHKFMPYLAVISSAFTVYLLR